MDINASPAAAPAENKLDLVRLFLVAAVLPTAIAAVNYALLHRLSGLRQDVFAVWTMFGWYVLQVGVMGSAVGRGITIPWLRWTVFGWNFLFINLLSALVVMSPSMQSHFGRVMPAAALVAGQTGLCVVWAFLGDTKWTIRWPAMIVATAGLVFLWLSLGNHGGQQMWTDLLVLQILTLSVLCGGLRLAGFRLLVVEAQQDLPTGEGGRLRPLQFGIKHVLIWTTALAIVLGVAKGLDLLRWQAAMELVRSGLLWKVTVATAAAIAIIAALWVALGQGHWLVRYLLGPMFVFAVGCGLAAWSSYNFATMNRLLTAGALISYQSDWELLRWYEFGWWWLGWIFLSSGLLAATLIILRVLGYRLVRLARPATAFRPSAK
jgi:hypothetical protein